MSECSLCADISKADTDHHDFSSHRSHRQTQHFRACICSSLLQACTMRSSGASILMRCFVVLRAFDHRCQYCTTAQQSREPCQTVMMLVNSEICQQRERQAQAVAVATTEAGTMDCSPLSVAEKTLQSAPGVANCT